MTSKPLYMKPLPVCRATYTLYMRHHSHYLCSHTHSTDNITPTLCMTSHSPYVWYCLHYTTHHILILWPQTTVFMLSHQLYLTCAHCICVITSTVLMISHKLYFWDHTCYNSHHFPCTRHDSNCMPSQSLHSWHEIPYIWHHLQGLWHLDHTHVTSQPLCFWIHVNYI